MSEFTECNYCRLQRIKRNKKKGTRIVILPSDFMNGKDIFVVPKGTKISEIKKWKGPSDKLPNGDRFYRKYHVVWFMGLSDACTC